MNTHFEQSFLQQIIDVLKGESEYFVILLDLIFNKFFLGRNCLFKNSDLRFIIKNTIGIYGAHFYLDKLLMYMNTKSKGGARTSFQLNQVFNLLTFVLEISSSKINGDETFKEKFNENHFMKFTQKIYKIVKYHLVDEESLNNETKEEAKKIENENDEKEKSEKKKNKKKKELHKKEKKNTFEMLLMCLTNFLDRLFSFEKKNNIIIAETDKSQNELFDANEKIIKLINKISYSLNYKNVLNKLNNMNKKEKSSDNDNKEEHEDNQETNEEVKMELEDD